MTALTLPSRVLPTARYDVYVKRVAGLAAPPQAGIIDSAFAGEGGWQFAEDLRMRRLTYGAWPRSRHAPH